MERPVHPLAALVAGLMAALDRELHPEDHDLERLKKNRRERTNTSRPLGDGANHEA